MCSWNSPASPSTTMSSTDEQHSAWMGEVRRYIFTVLMLQVILFSITPKLKLKGSIGIVISLNIGKHLV